LRFADDMDRTGGTQVTDSSNPIHPDEDEPKNTEPPTSAGPTVPPEPSKTDESATAMASLGPRQNLYGYASIVIGLLGLCFCGPFLAGISSGATYFLDLPVAIAAVLLGRHHVHRVRNGTSTNKSLGVIGIVLGVLGVIVAILFGSTHAGTTFHHEVK
jgi:hypothetical protein